MAYGLKVSSCHPLSQDSLQTLYNTLVLPYLSYCTLVWGNKNNTNLESLFILQKKVIRTCTNSLWLEHTRPIFIALKTLKIRGLYIYQLVIHMFRHHRNLLPFRSPFNLVHQPIGYSQLYNTRHVYDLHIAPTNTKLAGNTITTQGPIIWNNMNAALKNCKSLATFKTCLKKYILDQYSSDLQ